MELNESIPKFSHRMAYRGLVAISGVRQFFGDRLDYLAEPAGVGRIESVIEKSQQREVDNQERIGQFMIKHSFGTEIYRYNLKNN